ncbi:MAG: endonuclease domain-containing protein [Myxococcaceae bacterium]|nr:endonuclease domain-containing protein [Myxococcaceae bacterium]
MAGRWERGVGALAARQLGVISLGQVQGAGVANSTRQHWVVVGRWERRLARVYRVRGAPWTWHQQLLAAVLWARPSAVASHRSAGWLWGLDGLGPRPPEPVDVTVAHDRRLSLETEVTLHRTRTFPKHIEWWKRLIPVTDLARTLIDLAGVLDETSFELALDSACRSKPRLLQWLERELARLGRRGRAGAAAVTKALRHRVDPALESALEVRVMRALRRAGLPRPLTQCTLHDASGRFLARVDFCWPDRGVVLEADGWRFHGSRPRWERDLARRNALTHAGYQVFNVTWDLVRTSGWLEALSAAVFSRTGE